MLLCRSLTPAVFVTVVAMVVAGCGSSATTSTTGPSSLTRCEVTPGAAPGVPAQGGTASINVSAARECAWTASTEGQWLSIKSGATGQGDGSVEFTAISNPDPLARRGAVVLNDKRVEVTQAAGECVFTIPEGPMTFGQSGGPGRVEVRTSSQLCTWKAETETPWILLRSAEGTGSSQVIFEVQPAAGPLRTGSIRIAGRSIAVTQSAGCSYSITPPSFAAPAAGTSSSLNIVTAPGCQWTAASDVNWLSFSRTSGDGPESLPFTVAPLTGQERTGTAIIAGQSFTVTQSQGCSFAISPTTARAPAQGGNGTVTVTAPQGCSWTASAQAGWVQITSGASGSGSGQVAYSVSPSVDGERTTTLTIGGQVFTITQSPGCSFALSSITAQFASEGGSGKVSVAAATGCTWSAAANADWIQVTGGATGAGNGEVAFNVAPSTSGAVRTGTLTIAGQTFTVTQAAGCTFTLSPASVQMPAEGGTGKVGIAAAAGCSWSAASTAEWIEVTSELRGSGSGEIAYRVAANGGAARTGTLTVGGQTFTVRQAERACTYTVKPLALEVAAGAHTVKIEVDAQAGCAWTATSGASWLSIVSGAAGTAKGDVEVAIEENPMNGQRKGTVTVAGQTVTITQKNR